MNDSNIVAIPNHPPLPRAVTGMFHSVEHPYSSTRETKAHAVPQRLPTERDLHQYRPYEHQQQVYRPAPNAYADPYNRPRSNSGALAFPMQPLRRDSSASFGSNEAGPGPMRNSMYAAIPSDMPLSTAVRSVRTGSVVSENSSETMDDKAGSTSDRKYVCDWRNCGQSFDRIEHLNRHKRRHTGEKPYRCLAGRCTKLFSRFDNMMQHVGIHTFEGAKTEIPNIKNLSQKGNGRGRARRTSYRGTQDSQDKFRRHVEGTLGSKLAKGCILPADTPDFSNLTLRPLLNDLEAQQDAIAEDVPLSERVAPASQQSLTKSQRRDSVIGTMDAHLPPYDSSSSRAPVAGNRPYDGFSRFHPLQRSYPQPSSSAESSGSRPIDHRHSLSVQPPSAHISNLRGQPGYPREYTNV
ncbi:hypothetical protein H4R20_005475 [Coemansia guatemalensis]|uniref:C2H2-type domain-containing protein n=1 Tax=Coemansia guatemalensis TaxID=2761395 RepID=A0A9W8LS38_9FUNG|nr:hypothetical protein H4R20_005475 [Coemansia guatemalensis]